MRGPTTSTATPKVRVCPLLHPRTFLPTHLPLSACPLTSVIVLLPKPTFCFLRIHPSLTPGPDTGSCMQASSSRRAARRASLPAASSRVSWSDTGLVGLTQSSSASDVESLPRSGGAQKAQMTLREKRKGKASMQLQETGIWDMLGDQCIHAFREGGGWVCCALREHCATLWCLTTHWSAVSWAVAWGILDRFQQLRIVDREEHLLHLKWLRPSGLTIIIDSCRSCASAPVLYV